MLERVEHRRKPVITGVALGGDAKRRFTSLRHVREIAFDLAKLLDHRLRFRAEMFADARRDESSPGALEELPADALLEIRELVAERGLGEVKLLTCASEIAELGNRGDESEIADFEANHGPGGRDSVKASASSSVGS